METNSGGLLVKWEGLSGFVPFSHCRDIANRDDAEAFAKLRGQSFEFNVLETDRPEFKLTRTAIGKREILSGFSEGQVLDGTVAGIAARYAFVKVAKNCDGRVHISELSRGWVNQVTDVVSVGQSVKVRVLSVDVEKEHLSLSIKDTLPDPWDDIDSFLPVGEERDGKVRRIEDNKRVVFDIGDGLEGLIHSNHLGDRKLEEFDTGAEVRIVIHNIDRSNTKIWVRIATHEPA